MGWQIRNALASRAQGTVWGPTLGLPWSAVGAVQELAGTTAIAIGASADLELIKELAATAALTVGGTGALTLGLDLAGSAAVAIGATADLSSGSGGGVFSSARIVARLRSGNRKRFGGR